MASRTFTAAVEGTKTAAYVVMPFDPDGVWGARPRHHLRGTVNGCGFRGPLEQVDGEWRCSLGPVWRRDNGVELGDTLTFVLEEEGPQREAVDPDIAEALEASPKAGAAFDGLAQFYRKAFLKWIDGTKKRPEERVRRIAEMVSLLEAGKRTRN
ncbi:YdeI/OmpD-associated family protein [Aeromicrobium sp.]|uniref:YdeI/OmpD-associated family protein n=1 Tax=Aeromicrobium sp. TaxID=1871063 RepID=UPI002FC8AF61